MDDDRLIAADTGNHRLLIWEEPDGLSSHCDADVVLGQADFTSEGAQAAGRGPERGFHLPTGVVVVAGRLIVADTWNHRVLIWDEVPRRSDVAPDVILGQPDACSTEANRGGACGPLGFYWPFGIAFVDGWFWVADTGNRRVLGWDGVPSPDHLPDVVLGQPDGWQRDENRGEVGPASFRWPHDIAGTADRLFVADAGNHRILLWSPPPKADGPAQHVLGQPDFSSTQEFPYQPQSATALRFPYAIDVAAHEPGLAAVADTANNRVLVWRSAPEQHGDGADWVLGQPEFESNGENRWSSVAEDTFCWPYGLKLHRPAVAESHRLAVADSGNNRIMVWELGL